MPSNKYQQGVNKKAARIGAALVFGKGGIIVLLTCQCMYRFVMKQLQCTCLVAMC
jgi:hypothetical protein